MQYLLESTAFSADICWMIFDYCNEQRENFKLFVLPELKHVIGPIRGKLEEYDDPFDSEDDEDRPPDDWVHNVAPHRISKIWPSWYLRNVEPTPINYERRLPQTIDKLLDSRNKKRKHESWGKPDASYKRLMLSPNTWCECCLRE